ncbi:MAG: NgoPII family restriction endonuclease [Eubacteriales bacterium]
MNSTNIIKAIINLYSDPITELKTSYVNNNRANAMGDALELYVKDIFSGTISENDEEKRNIKYNKYFSYLGNKNNPPDAILKSGDALEVKKIESKNNSLALNSSYPKAKLYSNSTLISNSCRQCEKWDVKDIIYIVGVLKKDKLSSLCMVYGEDYAADSTVYERIKNTIKDGVTSIENIEFSESKELGHINRVDPLGITYLRVRGMWGIENPFKVFEYVYQRDESNEFNFMAIINEEKYNGLEYTDKLEIMASQNNNLSIKDIKIKNPNNPAILKNAKLISFSI